jgi:NAD(P)-dependent dehydrogenase (short-subunit alcohol dehydrogenase family)
LELCRQLAAGDQYSTIFGICRKSSEGLEKLESESGGKVKLVENVEITAEDATTKVQKIFGTAPIHLLVHNAGAYGPPEHMDNLYASQALENIDAERMRFAFELNTLAPLLLTKALLPNLKEAAGENDPSKVIIISSAMGSIADNESGGHYGYRTAKAAVNMIGKSLAVDLKDKRIAVSLGTD